MALTITRSDWVSAMNLVPINEKTEFHLSLMLSRVRAGQVELAFQDAEQLAKSKKNVSYDLAGFETEFGYNGRSAWARNSRDGLLTLTGKASTDMQALAYNVSHPAQGKNVGRPIKRQGVAGVQTLASHHFLMDWRQLRIVRRQPGAP